jgi:hypothetical protein
MVTRFVARGLCAPSSTFCRSTGRGDHLFGWGRNRRSAFIRAVPVDTPAISVAIGASLYLTCAGIVVFAVTSISIIRPGKKSLFTSTVVDAGNGPSP